MTWQDSSPNLIERCAVLAAVKTASRRLRRWPAASLDRRSARLTVILQAGAEKRPINRTKKLRAISVPASRATIDVSEMPARWKRTIRPSILE
jgi:hypothetical protein